MGRIKRSKEDVIITGVLSGISNYFRWDPLILRLIFLILFLFTNLLVGWLYIILALCVNE